MSKFALAAEVASKFRTLFPEAVVAGGYLRDLCVGAPPKDIDVFIGRRMLDQVTMEDTLGRALGDRVALEFNLGYTNMGVRRVFTQVAGEQLPIQVIELDVDDPVARILEHDFGLCQVWHDGESLRTTGHFEHDLQWKTCTLVHCENAAEHKRSMRRWMRLKDKLGPLGYSLRDRTLWGTCPKCGAVGFEKDLDRCASCDAGPF